MNSISGQSDFEFACNKLAEILEVKNTELVKIGRTDPRLKNIISMLIQWVDELVLAEQSNITTIRDVEKLKLDVLEKYEVYISIIKQVFAII